MCIPLMWIQIHEITPTTHNFNLVRVVNKKRILHVEDDEDTLNLVRLLLSKKGYDVTSVTNGKDAIDRFKKEKFDLVLLDIMLPDTSGWEVYSKLKKISDSVRVLFLSVIPPSESILPDEGGRNIMDYITKPFDNEDLIMQVEKILEKKKRILHVDDDDDTCRLVREILERNNYRVVTASCGEECLEMLSKEDFDLILLDMILPDMSGWNLFHKIKKMPKEKPRTVFLSIIPLSEDQMSKFREHGILDYIQKPFNSEELISKINSILS